MRQLSIWAAFAVSSAFPILHANPAMALAGQAGVVSGSTVKFNGTTANLNKISVNYGNTIINNLPVYMNGAALQTKTVGANTQNAALCSDIAGNPPVQQNSSVYYVYFFAASGAACTLNSQCVSNSCVANACTLGYTQVVSSYNPYTEGYPTHSLSCRIPWTATNTGTLYGPTSNAVFLGSYITDGSSDVVPFERMGEQVTLMINTGQRQTGGTIINFTPTSTGLVGGAGVYPQTQKTQINITPGAVTFPIPLSASSAIANVNISTTAGNETFGIVDANLQTVLVDNSYYPSISFTFGSAFSMPQLNYQYVRVVPDSAGFVYAVLANKPAVGMSVTLTAQYQGYVESVHHLQ
jgi:hypothetical protein